MMRRSLAVQLRYGCRKCPVIAVFCSFFCIQVLISGSFWHIAIWAPHRSGIRNSYHQLPKIMTITSTKQSYSYHPERYTGRLLDHPLFYKTYSYFCTLYISIDPFLNCTEDKRLIVGQRISCKNWRLTIPQRVPVLLWPWNSAIYNPPTYKNICAIMCRHMKDTATG